MIQMRKVVEDVSFFVSIHIPKTAGTSLSVVLDRCFARRILFDYPEVSEYYSANPLFATHRDFITQYFKGIHGHFGAARHSRTFSSAKFISTVRHPVDRIISQYLHEYNDGGPMSYWHKPIRSGQIDIVEFAALEGVGNAMAKHLAGIDLKEYDLLLVTEQMTRSLHLLNYVIGNLHLPTFFGDPPQIPHENSHGLRLVDQRFDEKTRRAIYQKAAPDVEVYMTAMELLKEKTRRYLEIA